MLSKRIKRLKRALRKGGVNARARIAAIAPEPVRRTFAPVVNYADMLLFDHLFVRVVFLNRHKLAPNAWRAAQPLPYQLRLVKSLGVRTVVNLRGNGDMATARMERAACDRLGLAYIDYCLRSRDAPSKAALFGLRDLFQRIEHPILLHCKSGADRAGLASAIYLHVVEGVPIAQAARQLSLRFGHVRYADTGVLDAFFDLYLTHAAQQPIAFFDWVERHYEPRVLKESFRSRGWANRIVSGVLRRE